MDNRRRFISYGVVIVVALVLIGWLIASYLVKRGHLLTLGTNEMPLRVQAARHLLEKEQLEPSLPAQPIIRRSKAAEALGLIAADPELPLRTREEALRVLGVILRDQEDAPRRWARRALVEQGDRAVPTLMAALYAGGGTAEQAIIALHQIGPQTSEFVRMLLAEGGARAAAAEALAKAGGVGIEALLRACYNAEGGLRVAAMNNLGQQRVKAAVDACLFNLQPIAGSEKGAAISALGLIGERRAVPYLIPFLTDPGHRRGAATSLGLIGDPRAVEPLLATLTETEREYREAAILALRRIGAPALPALVRELQSPEVLMRRAAASALIGAGAAHVNPALARALRDPDDEVRASAALALGWSGNTGAVPFLVAALDDRDWRVVDAAVEALGDIGPAAVGQLLAVLRDPSHSATIHYQVARGLAHMGRPAVPALLEALSSPEANVQKWVAVALGEIGDQRAVPALRALAERASGDLRWVVEEQIRLLAGIAGS